MGSWVFGYGSLMCHPSLVEFLGREVGPGEWSLASLAGYRRLWNTAMDNTRDEPGTRFWAGPDGAGDHARGGATFLTGMRPKKTAGSDIQLGISVDQMAA